MKRFEEEQQDEVPLICEDTDLEGTTTASTLLDCNITSEIETFADISIFSNPILSANALGRIVVRTVQSAQNFVQ